MKNERCPICKKGKLTRSERYTRRIVGGHTFEAHLPVEVCDACGEGIYPPGVLSRFDLQVAESLARAGVATPEAIRFMRSTLGVTARALARLFDVRPESVSRWENGKRPLDRPTLAILHALVADALSGSTTTRDLLAALEAPHNLPRRIKIDVAGGAARKAANPRKSPSRLALGVLSDIEARRLRNEFLPPNVPPVSGIAPSAHVKAAGRGHKSKVQP